MFPAAGCGPVPFQMVGKSIKGSGGGKVTLGKAKQHFFKDLDLSHVITPADDETGSFTGGSRKPLSSITVRSRARLACADRGGAM